MRPDLTAGIVVAVVALPLALGFGVTSGAGAAAGLTTAIIAGFVAAVAGGSKFQVSGPTGAMVVVLVPIVSQVGPTGLFAVGLLAGLMVVVAGVLRLGRFVGKIPWSVMEGFTLGIAIVIALQQLPLIFEVERGSSTESLVSAFETLERVFSEPIHYWSILAVAGTLAVKIGWNSLRAKFSKLRSIPASGVAVVMLTALISALSLPVVRIGDLPVGDLFRLNIAWPAIDAWTLVSAALVVALLAGIESLLSARVADSMVHRRDGEVEEPFQPNRELIGQGLATAASAVFGGMPATGAIARSAVNVNAGAKSRLAAATHSLALLVMVIFLSPLVSQIPTAVLAGVLLGASWRIANPRSIRENLQSTHQAQITYLATAIAVVAIDLIWGIAIGLVIHFLVAKVSRN